MEISMNGNSRIRMVLAKIGLDGHDRGIRLVGRTLRDAGIEVIYLKFVTVEEAAKTVLEEDADAIGVSLLTGSHRILLPRLVSELKRLGCDDVAITAGGIIPSQDFQQLKEAGVDEIFGPGTPTESIVASIKELVAARK